MPARNEPDLKAGRSSDSGFSCSPVHPVACARPDRPFLPYNRARSLCPKREMFRCEDDARVRTIPLSRTIGARSVSDGDSSVTSECLCITVQSATGFRAMFLPSIALRRQAHRRSTSAGIGAIRNSFVMLTVSVRSLLKPRVKLVALVPVTASSFRVSFLTLVGFEFYSAAPNIVRENNSNSHLTGSRVGE